MPVISVPINCWKIRGEGFGVKCRRLQFGLGRTRAGQASRVAEQLCHVRSVFGTLVPDKALDVCVYIQQAYAVSK